jgi:hypothetical protein
LNGDRAVDFADFVILANNFGQSRPRVAARSLAATWHSNTLLQRASASVSATDEAKTNHEEENQPGDANAESVVGIFIQESAAPNRRLMLAYAPLHIQDAATSYNGRDVRS